MNIILFTHCSLANLFTQIPLLWTLQDPHLRQCPKNTTLEALRISRRDHLSQAPPLLDIRGCVDSRNPGRLNKKEHLLRKDVIKVHLQKPRTLRSDVDAVIHGSTVETRAPQRVCFLSTNPSVQFWVAYFLTPYAIPSTHLDESISIFDQTKPETMYVFEGTCLYIYICISYWQNA